MGTLLANDIRGSICNSGMVAAVGGELHRVSNQIALGDVTSAVKAIPVELQAQFIPVANASFLHGLNLIILVGTLIAFGGAVSTFAISRRRYLH